MKIINLKQKGFTFVELLVIISIIGLLSTLVILKLSNVRENARLNKALHFSSQIQYAMGIDAVAYYTFDDGTAKDYSGYGNNGTIFGATSVDGLPELKKALSFDGVNDYVSLPIDLVNVSNIRAGGITYTAWIKSTNISAEQRIVGQQISSGYSDYCSGGLGITAAGKAKMIAYDDNISYKSIETTTTLEENEWYFITGTYNPNDQKIRVYLNGNLEGTPVTITTFSRIFVNTSNRIGNKDNTNTYHFNGLIDDVRIYNSALSLAQIQQQYAKGLPSHSVVMK